MYLIMCQDSGSDVSLVFSINIRNELRIELKKSDWSIDKPHSLVTDLMITDIVRRNKKWISIGVDLKVKRENRHLRDYLVSILPKR